LSEGPSADVYLDWLSTYDRVVGEPLPFLHLDIDFGREGWAREAVRSGREIERLGVDFGVFYRGSDLDLADGDWTALAGERIKEFEGLAGGRPSHVLFQSWHDKPDRSFPDSDRTTFTGLIRLYAQHPEALGVLTSGRGANRAFRAKVTASSDPSGTVADAVDGNVATWWAAEAHPPQWIELDLGEPVDLASIRLISSQDPVGFTTHRLLVGEDRDSLEEVWVFSAETGLIDEFVWHPEGRRAVRLVRIETVESPSWVSWREVIVVER
jgi:hypothetical protein